MNEKLKDLIRREARDYVSEVFDALGFEWTTAQLDQAVEYLVHLAEYTDSGHGLAIARMEKDAE